MSLSSMLQRIPTQLLESFKPGYEVEAVLPKVISLNNLVPVVEVE